MATNRLQRWGIALMLAGAALAALVQVLPAGFDWANAWDLVWRGAWASSRVIIVGLLEIAGLYIALWSVRLVLVQPKPTEADVGLTDQGRALWIAALLIPVGLAIIWGATELLP